MDLTLRAGTAVDLPQLIDIYNHYVVNTTITFDLAPVTLEQRRVWLAQFAAVGRHQLLVAEAQGQLLGYACSQQFRVKPAYDTTVELTCYCAPGAAGRGIGTQLYTALFAALASEDIHSYIAGIALPNDASLVFHRKHGFVPAGTMHAVGRKFGSYWDVAFYERVVAQ
ncbi:MAG: N-acetyltransferase family protein [Polyangiales bacterium]